jgi:hypothetical protein
MTLSFPQTSRPPWVPVFTQVTSQRPY